VICRSRFEAARNSQANQMAAPAVGANVMDFPHDAHRALIEDFLVAVRNGRQPQVSGSEALETHVLIEQILARSTGSFRGLA
jgi:predicted dehydrogenase